jgi:hypothetical protein
MPAEAAQAAAAALESPEENKQEEALNMPAVLRAAGAAAGLPGESRQEAVAAGAAAAVPESPEESKQVAVAAQAAALRAL